MNELNLQNPMVMNWVKYATFSPETELLFVMLTIPLNTTSENPFLFFPMYTFDGFLDKHQFWKPKKSRKIPRGSISTFRELEEHLNLDATSQTYKIDLEKPFMHE